MANDTNFQINLENFNVDFKAKINNNFDTRYIKPKWSPELTSAQLKYRNAEKLAEDIILHENSRYFAIIDGSFIFGDFIEALVVNNNLLLSHQGRVVTITPDCLFSPLGVVVSQMRELLFYVADERRHVLRVNGSKEHMEMVCLQGKRKNLNGE